MTSVFTSVATPALSDPDQGVWFPPLGVSLGFLLLEDNICYLLLEDGCKIILE